VKKTQDNPNFISIDQEENSMWNKYFNIICIFKTPISCLSSTLDAEEYIFMMLHGIFCSAEVFIVIDYFDTEEENFCLLYVFLKQSF
jgi:hypothetical protein